MSEQTLLLTFDVPSMLIPPWISASTTCKRTAMAQALLAQALHILSSLKRLLTTYVVGRFEEKRAPTWVHLWSMG